MAIEEFTPNYLFVNPTPESDPKSSLILELWSQKSLNLVVKANTKARFERRYESVLGILAIDWEELQRFQVAVEKIRLRNLTGHVNEIVGQKVESQTLGGLLDKRNESKSENEIISNIKFSKRNQINRRKRVMPLPRTGRKLFRELMYEMVNMSIVIFLMLEEFNLSPATISTVGGREAVSLARGSSSTIDVKLGWGRDAAMMSYPTDGVRRVANPSLNGVFPSRP
ncbi:hypothetical protein Scep_014622 [Stephania cephalantha]|uniref:Uncharacterized protein n=1 Tax=Stephania cephalantha TaxID=152367 RepID=A0AAP0J468_9MAGN